MMQYTASQQQPLSLKRFSERAMLLLGITATLFLLYNYISWRSDIHENSPALDQIMQLKVNLVSDHVLFEEMARGYLPVPLAQVKESINQTRQMIEESVAGLAHLGHIHSTLPEDEQLSRNLMGLQKTMHQLVVAMGQGTHFSEQSPVYHQHDLLFKEAMGFAEAADMRMHQLIEGKLAKQQRIFLLAISIWLITMALVIWRWRSLATRFSTSSDQLNKLSHAVEQTGESMLISDKNGVIEYVNPAFTTVTGYDYEEVLGKNPSLLSSGQQDQKFYKNMWDLILSGKVWRGEVVDKRKDGSLYRALMSISPIKDESGSVSHFVAVQRDITELRETQESLLHAQKMDAIGTICCGLAHDMNNTLSIVLGNIELARMDQEANANTNELLVQAEGASLFAVSMIQELMAFSRKDHLSLEPLDVPQTAQHLQTILQPVCGQVKLQLEVGEDVDFILGDKLQIHRIVTNLVKNACDALENRESPSITMRIEAVSAELLQEKAQSLTHSRWVRLSVADNGHGIEPQLLEKVFDPFFTTKEVGKGTGLGLSSVYGMMQSHHGFVDIDSIVGQGTTFHLYFPCAAGAID